MLRSVRLVGAIARPVSIPAVSQVASKDTDLLQNTTYPREQADEVRHTPSLHSVSSLGQGLTMMTVLLMDALLLGMFWSNTRNWMVNFVPTLAAAFTPQLPMPCR